MRRTRHFAGSAVQTAILGSLLALVGVAARADMTRDADGATVESQESRSRGEQREDAQTTVYVPPSRGAPGVRTGGGTRGRADAPRIAVLAPDHVGITTRAQPTLAWYLSGDTDAPIVVTVIEDTGVEPLVEAPLPGPHRAGVHLVDLASLGVTLKEGTTYDWSVSLVLDPDARDADVVAGGALELRPVTSELAQALAGPGPAYRALARNGVWYDAIADLSSAIAAAPADASLRAERASLLEQVGVGAAAAFDRETPDVASGP